MKRLRFLTSRLSKSLYEPEAETMFGETQAVKKFLRVGWRVDRQKGSHVMLVKDHHPYTLSIPQHRELGVGILKSLIKQDGLSF